MQAIVQDRYGPPEVLELREVERPAVGDGDVLVRVRAAPSILRTGTSCVPARSSSARRGPACEPRRIRSGERTRPGRSRQGRDTAQAGRRGLRLVSRRVRGVRLRRPEPLRAEACGPLLRGRRRPTPGRVYRAPGTARHGRRGAGPGRPDHRGGRRRGHVCRPDRQGARVPRHRCLQHGEAGSRPFARRRPRHRLHAGGLHARRAAVRPDPPAGGNRLAFGLPARAHPDRDAGAEQRRGPVRGNRSRPARACVVTARAPAAPPVPHEGDHRGPRDPGRAGRSRQGHAGDRQDLSAERRPDAIAYLEEGHARGKVVITV